MPHPLRLFHSYNDSIASLVSLTSNVLLLVVATKVKTNDLKAYSVILKQMCCIDLFFSSIVFVSKPLNEFNNGTFFLFVTGFVANVPHPYNWLLNCLWVLGLFFCVSALPVPFFYRYQIICKETVLKTRTFALLFFISFVFALLYTIICGLAFIPTEESIEQNAYLLRNSLWLDEDGNLPIFVASTVNNVWLCIMLSYALSIGGICFLMIATFNFLILRRLAEERHKMSEKTREIQRQLTYALITQAASPLFTAIIPISIVCVCLFLKANTSGAGIFIMSSLGWITVINPTCAMVFIGPYRRFILSKIGLDKERVLFFKRMPQTTETVVRGLSLATKNEERS